MQGEFEENSGSCKEGLQSHNDLNGDSSDKTLIIVEEDYDIHHNNDASKACELQVTTIVMYTYILKIFLNCMAKLAKF